MKRTVIVVFLCLIAMGSFYRSCKAEPTAEDIKALGVGMWCFELKHRYGTAEEMAEKASSVGLRSVRLKVHNGVEEFRDAPSASTVAVAMHKKGILVLFWGFNYANDPEEEAKLIISFLERDECDGYVFNTEEPLEKTGKWAAEERLVKIVRDHRDACTRCSHKLLGFSTFAIPSVHSSLNYKTFVENTDFIEPQIYWGNMKKKPRIAVLWTFSEWQDWEKRNGINKPIIPLGQAFNPRIDGVRNSLKKGEIEEFGRLVKGYYGVSFWCWQRATPEYWEEITAICQSRKTVSSTEAHPVTIPTVLVSSGVKPIRNGSWWKEEYFPVLAGLLLILVVFLTVYEVGKEARFRVGFSGLAIALLWPIILIISVCLFMLVSVVRLIRYVYLGTLWLKTRF